MFEMQTGRRFPLLLLLLVTPLVAWSCNSGSSNPSGPRSITFTPLSTTPPSNSVTLQQVSTTSNTVVIEVRMTQVNGVFAASFDLVYSSTVASFVSASEGTFLNSGGATTQLIVNSTTPGRVIVGLSRLSASSGGASGSGTLMTVTLRSVAVGTTGVSFENARLGNPSGTQIAGVVFSGGTIDVR
jgi:hypothetical protein